MQKWFLLFPIFVIVLNFVSLMSTKTQQSPFPEGRSRGKGATASIRRQSDIELAQQRGCRIRWGMAQAQPEAEPQLELETEPHAEPLA
jgi:hypothetical protein